MIRNFINPWGVDTGGKNFLVLTRDEDPVPDPVGSVYFWAAGSITFFNGSGSGSYL